MSATKPEIDPESTCANCGGNNPFPALKQASDPVPVEGVSEDFDTSFNLAFPMPIRGQRETYRRGWDDREPRVKALEQALREAPELHELDALQFQLNAANGVVPVEGVMLPDIDASEKERADCSSLAMAAMKCGSPIEMMECYVLHTKVRERQLTEAIAQRDAAWKDVALLAHNHPFGGLYHALTEAQAEREKACNAVMTMQLKLGTAEAALTAMTEDRNLWQNAHDEDCPNKAALATERKDKAQLQYALEQSESKFPTERARVLQDLKRVWSVCWTLAGTDSESHMNFTSEENAVGWRDGLASAGARKIVLTEMAILGIQK